MNKPLHSPSQNYQNSSLWQTAFSIDNGNVRHDQARQRIKLAYEQFRERVKLLLNKIQADLPGLTLHDITHVDALWDVASTIAGKDYPLNPAEALVLGGAFLLHDAAHCLAAYPGGLKELQDTDEWRDAAALLRQNNPRTFANLDAQNLKPGQAGFEEVLFATLRVLHPKQAKKLAFAKWTDDKADDKGQQEFLFPDSELRAAYGDVIGEVAESHWFDPHALEVFANQSKTAPTCLGGAPWVVDKLKVALLLRVADACHMDARRAPRFLMLLQKPTGLSAKHWLFQSKLHTVTCDLQRQELSISGQPFAPHAQEAWWLAFDAINLAHKELQSADALLRDHTNSNLNRQRFAARGFDGAHNPTRFAETVRTDDKWLPVDTSLRVSQIQTVVERFGGKALYGDEPWCALRELIQNARDAIHAARNLDYLEAKEGAIHISAEPEGEGVWLKVRDDGIGMSRYVLTEVLLDFGRSLWRSESLRGEWSGLARSGFESIGQFGIGFFAVFMLGDQVIVRTRRQEAKDQESDKGWELRFEQGLRTRPLLTAPTTPFKKRGTEVAVFMTQARYEELLTVDSYWGKKKVSLQARCAWLAPALDIDVHVKENNSEWQTAVQANDWLKLSNFDLAKRFDPRLLDDKSSEGNGYWDEFTPIEEDGKCVGCMTVGGHVSSGVIKGIRAGEVESLSGLIFVEQQSDLARRSAIPAVSCKSLQKWAMVTNVRIKDRSRFDLYKNRLLVVFGVPHNDLGAIGQLGKDYLSFLDLHQSLKKYDTVLWSDSDVSVEFEDDVTMREFRDGFVPEHHLFVLKDRNQEPNWLSQIPNGGVDTSTWSLRSALELALTQAWGGYEMADEETEEIVGHVGETPIYRNVRVIKRLPQKVGKA